MANYRNWLELPRDLMLTILMKLPQSYILESIQCVCKPWHDLCKEPSLWRSIKVLDYDKMVLDAIDRSAGGLIDLDVLCFFGHGLCSYVASRSTQLKRLRLVYCTISSEDFMEGLPKLSSLNELEFTICDFPSQKPEHEQKMISVIKSCPPSITTFKFNPGDWRRRRSWIISDKVATTIAESLPQLRHLQLIGHEMTDVGLTTILDRCSRLQSLDLRLCFNLDLEGDLGKRLSKQVTDLKLPYEPIEDCDYPILNYDDGYSD